MAKGHDYGIGTKSELDAVTVGSGTYQSKEALTYAAVTTAIRNYKETHPNFDDLSAQVAAQKISGMLKDEGFKNVRASGGKVTDGTTSVQLTHAKNADGRIVAKLPKEERRKKRK